MIFGPFEKMTFFGLDPIMAVTVEVLYDLAVVLVREERLK